MAKRRSEIELTHDNWNDDLPSEEAGSFCMAPSEEIDKRVIKKAKRRFPETQVKAAPSVFANFSGFGKSANANGKMFDFLSNSTKTTDLNKKADITTDKGNELEVKFTSGAMNATGSSGDDVAKLNPTSSANTSSPLMSKTISKARMEYLQQLRKLNEDFVAWVKGHIDKNPYLDLTPVFKDYTDHLKQIEDKYPDGCNLKKPLSSVCLLPVKPVTKEPEITPVNQAVVNQVAIASVTKPQEQSVSTEQNAEEEEETYQTEVKVIEEENTRYKTRCKLFYKKDDRYVDKGVGTLYIKSIESGKSVLLVRAETTLGNILLNICLNRNIPVQRMGKNNVTLVCIPNPPISIKNDDSLTTVTYLIRVKDAEMADELLRHLNEAKQ